MGWTAECDISSRDFSVSRLFSKKSLSIGLENFGLKKSLGIGLKNFGLKKSLSMT